MEIPYEKKSLVGLNKFLTEYERVRGSLVEVTRILFKLTGFLVNVKRILVTSTETF